MRLFLTAFLIVMIALIVPVRAEVYQQGVVYVIYQTAGADAVPATDVNDNGVPDMVEDAATQINAARAVFHDVFKYPDPLGCERYPDITAVEVVVISRDTLKGNGVAYSGAGNKSRRNKTENVLLIKIASDLPKTNETPAHEYFHLIQYGVTRFSNSWFLEGMARWSQDSIAQIKKYPDGKDVSRKLTDKVSDAQIFNGKYNASNILWYPLASALKDKATIPRSITKKYRYADGSTVFQDDVICGANVMRRVLLALPPKEALAAEEFGGQTKWRKDGRASKLNNKYILDCVRDVFNERRS